MSVNLSGLDPFLVDAAGRLEGLTYDLTPAEADKVRSARPVWKRWS